MKANGDKVAAQHRKATNSAMRIMSVIPLRGRLGEAILVDRLPNLIRHDSTTDLFAGDRTSLVVMHRGFLNGDRRASSQAQEHDDADRNPHVSLPICYWQQSAPVWALDGKPNRSQFAGVMKSHAH